MRIMVRFEVVLGHSAESPLSPHATRGLCMLLDLLSVTFLMLRECCSAGTLGEFQHTWHWQLLVSNCPAWPCLSNAACDFYGSEV